MAIIIDYAADARPIPVKSIVDRAGLALQDEEHVRWTTLELFEWINEGAAMIVSLKPAAGAKMVVLALDAGAQQRIDDEVVQQFDLVCNVGADEQTPGRAIRRTERHLLDSANPNWHSMKPSGTIKHYTWDDRTPNAFFVYPPAVADTRVMASLAVLPDDVTSVDDALVLNVKYSAALLNYVLFRAFSKESEFGNGTLAAAYYEAFKDALGLSHQAEIAASPNNKVPA